MRVRSHVLIEKWSNAFGKQNIYNTTNMHAKSNWVFEPTNLFFLRNVLTCSKTGSKAVPRCCSNCSEQQQHPREAKALNMKIWRQQQQTGSQRGLLQIWQRCLMNKGVCSYLLTHRAWCDHLLLPPCGTIIFNCEGPMTISEHAYLPLQPTQTYLQYWCVPKASAPKQARIIPDASP